MKHIFLMMFLLVTASAAIAEPMPESDLPFRLPSWEIRYEVNADGSFVETHKWSRTVLKDNALEVI